MNRQTVVDGVFDLFNQRGHRQYGEDVTEQEHALQCATFALHKNESEDVIAACLLHDYGHLLHDLGENIADQGVDAHHEELGAQRLAGTFTPEVIEPIRLHVAAKRYLCFKDAAYLDGLSAASRLSLQLQGGVMSVEEAREFETHPHFDAALRVRRFDDMGKVKGMRTPPLEEFRAILEKYVISGEPETVQLR